MKYLKKYTMFTEDADFLLLPSNLSNDGSEHHLTFENKNEIGFIQKDIDSKLHLFSSDEYGNITHSNYFESYLYDRKKAEENVKEYILRDDFETEQKYQIAFEKSLKEEFQDQYSDYEIKGRIWPNEKVIGFWFDVDFQFSKEELKRIVDGINKKIDFKIDGDWLLHIEKQKFVKLSEFTSNLISVDVKKRSKDNEILHLMKSKDKKKALRNMGYKPKRSSKADWLRKGVYSTYENTNSEINNLYYSYNSDLDVIKENILFIMNNFEYTIFYTERKKFVIVIKFDKTVVDVLRRKFGLIFCSRYVSKSSVTGISLSIRIGNGRLPLKSGPTILSLHKYKYVNFYPNQEYYSNVEEAEELIEFLHNTDLKKKKTKEFNL